MVCSAKWLSSWYSNIFVFYHNKNDKILQCSINFLLLLTIIYKCLKFANR